MTPWQDIESAPRDGTAVRVRGFNFGLPLNGRHHCLARFDGLGWVEAEDDGAYLPYLTDWRPPAPSGEGG